MTNGRQLWFAQNSLPLRWQIQRQRGDIHRRRRCDLLKIHYLCGDKYNLLPTLHAPTTLWFAQNSLPLRWQIQLAMAKTILKVVVICSKFITFAVTNTTHHQQMRNNWQLWFAQNSLPLRWQIQPYPVKIQAHSSCDLLKIHYLCGDKYNHIEIYHRKECVVICSKFITFAVTNTTQTSTHPCVNLLWFAQNSLPLRWQIQQE